MNPAQRPEGALAADMRQLFPITFLKPHDETPPRRLLLCGGNTGGTKLLALSHLFLKPDPPDPSSNSRGRVRTCQEIRQKKPKIGSTKRPRRTRQAVLARP